MFGGNRGHLYHFWPEFKKALTEAHKFYPKAIIEVKNDCIILKDSPPLGASQPHHRHLKSVDNSMRKCLLSVRLPERKPRNLLSRLCNPAP